MKRMLVNLREPEESRVAVMAGDRLEQIHIHRAGRPTIAGNIYRGRVVNVEQGIQAAFLDIGEDQKGFLHSSDVVPAALALVSGPAPVAPPSAVAPLQSILRKGLELPVQVSKEGMGKKGPSLTCQISIPGRYLVAMPFLKKRGVSRKIEGDSERRRLKEALEAISLPEEMGFIVRTAGMGRKKTDLEKDARYLVKVWNAVSQKVSEGGGPALLYRESEFVARTMRDFFSPDVEEVLVDTESGYAEALEFFELAMPRHVSRLKRYGDPEPVFSRFRVEARLAELFERRVGLGSGGSLVIDTTEAITAIDVNSGKFTGGADAEGTALKINSEAAREIARQVILRDLGGLIVIDFIDMKQEKNKREIEKIFKEAMKADRSRHSILKMSKFCLVEMTRQRVRHTLTSIHHDPCPACSGTGRVVNAESLCARILRKVGAAFGRSSVVRVEVRAAKSVAGHLLNRKRSRLAQLESASGGEITVLDRDGPLDEFEIHAFDEGNRRIRL